jgi:hypothetical protein
MSENNDLWPANIAESNMVTPVTILKEQAALLGDKTRQLVTGEVQTVASGTMFTHSFNITAPTLNYKFELFQISHGINFYPLTVRSGFVATINSEDELKKKLREIFASQHTMNVVHSILAQVRA